MKLLQWLLERLFSGIEATEARQRQQNGALLVDVREPYEWRQGHAPGARHIPLGELAGRLDDLPRDQEVLFICQSGMRSARAVAKAQKAGVKRVANVRGGMTAWKRAGLPVD